MNSLIKLIQFLYNDWFSPKAVALKDDSWCMMIISLYICHHNLCVFITSPRYKQKKEAEAKLSEIKSAVESGQADDEMVRDFYILNLRKWITIALEEIESIDQEIEILKQMDFLKQEKVPQGMVWWEWFYMHACSHGVKLHAIKLCFPLLLGYSRTTTVPPETSHETLHLN